VRPAFKFLVDSSAAGTPFNFALHCLINQGVVSRRANCYRRKDRRGDRLSPQKPSSGPGGGRSPSTGGRAVGGVGRAGMVRRSKSTLAVSRSCAETAPSLSMVEAAGVEPAEACFANLVMALSFGC
jgi:hypothetical protein